MAIPATPELIFALRDCYLGGREKPGFIYEGSRHCSFYSKDCRDKAGKIQYRSLIAYPKRDLDDGAKGLRVESSLHAEAISYSLGRKIALGQLPSCAPELQRHAWRQVDQRFKFLRPVSDEVWQKQTLRIRNEDSRVMMEVVGYLSKEVPLDRVSRKPFADRASVKKYMRRLNLGFGDPDRQELLAFARIREDMNDYFSIPY